MRVDLRLAAGHHVRGGRAEEGRSRAFGDTPLGARVRIAGAAVVQHDRGAREQAGDEEVPHHPAGGRVPEEAVLGPQVAVQAELLEVFDEDAALGLHDRLGEARRAGGVEHPQGVVERDLLEDGLHVGGGQRRPLKGVLGRLRAQQRDVHDGVQGGQFAAQFGDRVTAVVLLASVAVAVDGEQDHGFDLLEAVEDAAGAEVGGAGGPDPAHGGRGQKGDHGLGDVGEIAADPVSGAYTEGAQLCGQGADLAAQVGPRHGDGLVGLVDIQEGRFVRAGLRGAQGVLRVVEGPSGEPRGTGHGAVAEHARVGGREPDVEPLGDGLPERVQFVDRPAVQGRVASVGRRSVPFGRPGLELRDLRLGDALGGGLPER